MVLSPRKEERSGGWLNPTKRVTDYTPSSFLVDSILSSPLTVPFSSFSFPSRCLSVSRLLSLLFQLPKVGLRLVSRWDETRGKGNYFNFDWFSIKIPDYFDVLNLSVVINSRLLFLNDPVVLDKKSVNLSFWWGSGEVSRVTVPVYTKEKEGQDHIKKCDYAIKSLPIFPFLEYVPKFYSSGWGTSGFY